MKLLLVKTSSMGDVVHSFQAVHDAHRHIPGIEIDWCVEKPFAGIAGLHSAVRAVIPVRLRDWRRAPFSRETRGEVSALAQTLRARHYDLVIDAQGLMKSAFVARMARTPIAGFDRASAREPLATFTYSRTFAVPRNLHAVIRTRKLFAAALGYEPDLDDRASGVTPPATERPKPADRTVFLLHGTSREDKKWPMGHWVELAVALVSHGFTPVTTWSNDRERQVAESLFAQVPETVVVPRSPLVDIAAEIGRADCVIGADTGLMHLACGFGVPTIAIFNTTKPSLTGPYGERVAWVEAEAGDGPRIARMEPVIELFEDMMREVE